MELVALRYFCFLCSCHFFFLMEGLKQSHEKIRLNIKGNFMTATGAQTLRSYRESIGHKDPANLFPLQDLGPKGEGQISLGAWRVRSPPCSPASPQQFPYSPSLDELLAGAGVSVLSHPEGPQQTLSCSLLFAFISGAFRKVPLPASPNSLQRCPFRKHGYRCKQTGLWGPSPLLVTQVLSFWLRNTSTGLPWWSRG